MTSICLCISTIFKTELSITSCVTKSIKVLEISRTSVFDELNVINQRRALHVNVLDRH